MFVVMQHDARVCQRWLIPVLVIEAAVATTRVVVFVHS